jgi:hypothetical protein
MGIVNPTMGQLGGARGDGETNDRNALAALLAEFNGNIDTNNWKAAAGWVAGPLDATTLLAILGVTGGGVTRRGKSIIPGVDTTTATAYNIANLGGAGHQDVVSGVVLPTDGLIVVAYQALWKNTLVGNGRAAIFIGPTQAVVTAGATGGAPLAQNGAGPGSGNFAPLATTPVGLDGSTSPGVDDTEVTTGQIVAPSGSTGNGGATYLFAAAGTYDVSIQFKNNAAGTLSVKNRHLWVWTIGF